MHLLQQQLKSGRLLPEKEQHITVRSSARMDSLVELGIGDTRPASIQLEEWDPKDIEERKKYEYYLVDYEDREESSGLGSGSVVVPAVAAPAAPAVYNLSNVEDRIPTLIVDFKERDFHPRRIKLGNMLSDPEQLEMAPDSRCRWYHLWSNSMSSIEVPLICQLQGTLKLVLLY